MTQRLSDVPLAELVPETRDWNAGRGIDLVSWVGCVGCFEQAIAYAALFWPEFVEFDGCILLAGFNPETYYSCMGQSGSSRESVEAILNHRHIVDLFPNQQRQPTKEQVTYLGRLLKEMWLAKLQQDFPGRRFVVSFLEDDLDCLLNAEVTFYQQRT